MKIQVHPRQEGSALILTLLTAVVIGITLASYLTLVSSQNVSTMRSLAWNSTIPVLEAGVEEALAQIHYNGITNLAANGWHLSSSGSGGLFTKRRFLGDGTCFAVSINPLDPPVIFSTGFVPAPLSPSSQVGMILGGLLPPLPGDPNSGSSISYISRKIRVNTRRDPLFRVAMAADGQIDLSGNGVATDSFDSGDPRYNTNGKYDPAKTKDNGDVATNSGLVNSLDAGNADIKGHIATGPNGSIAIGPTGAAGSKEWVESGKSGIQPGWATDDMNVEFPDVKEPFTTGYSTPSGGIVDGTNYTTILGTGNFKLGSFTGKVLVTGQATLLVTDLVKFTGTDFIQIAPGASLKVYVAAPTAMIGGNGVINDGNALDFQYYGLPSNTSVSFNGNASYTGVVYAPQADFTLGGGGNDHYDFVGGSVTKTVKMNGHFQFHYDENLRRAGPIRDYIVTAWNEI